MNCIVCNKEITSKEQEKYDYFNGESLGEYWCKKCGMEGESCT